MKHYILYLTLLSGLILSSCSSVHVHYAENTDFSQYHSYAYIARKIKPHIPEPDARLITKHIDAFLRNEGLRPDQINPDLLVRIDIIFHKRVDVYHANSPWLSQEQSYEGIVKISLLDAKTHRAVWWTDLDITYHNQAMLTRILRRQMAKLAERYPPRQ